MEGKDSGDKTTISLTSYTLDPDLGGPAAILSISRDTCSDSVGKLFSVCVFWGGGYRINSRAICGKIAAIAQMCRCETKCPTGVSHNFGGALAASKRYPATWGIAAIASQYRAICGH